MDDLTKELDLAVAEAVNANSNLTIVLGADHAGFDLKQLIKTWLLELKYTVEDEGAYSLEPEDDYPFISKMVAKRVVGGGENFRGLIFGGSGQGEAMASNRIMGARAVVFYGGQEEIVRLTRDHNNANILALGARFVSLEQAKEMIKLWLKTLFSEASRHQRRIEELDDKIVSDNNF